MFGMLIYGATNFVSYVPSAGRFYSIGELLIIAGFVLFLGTEKANRKDRQISGALSSLLAVNIALGTKMVLEFTSIYLLFGNFFFAPFVNPDMALYEFVGWLL
jgi:hypothetical protein